MFRFKRGSQRKREREKDEKRYIFLRCFCFIVVCFLLVDMFGFSIHTPSLVWTNNTRHTRYGWPTNINKWKLLAFAIHHFKSSVHAPSLSTHLNLYSSSRIGLIVLTLCVHCVHLDVCMCANLQMWGFLCAHTRTTWQHPRHTTDKQECIHKYAIPKTITIVFLDKQLKQNFHSIVCIDI